MRRFPSVPVWRRRRAHLADSGGDLCAGQRGARGHLDLGDLAVNRIGFGRCTGGPHVLVIPGTGNPDHLAANVAAGALRLSADDLARLGEA